MGGSVNLQGGGQYSMPNIQGYGQNAANYGQTAAGFGSRFGMGNYGMPQQYDGGYGDYGGQFGNVSTGGKGFQQQPSYQPAPVMQPYVDMTSTGGKGFQARPTPSQATAYAPMNIPQMQLAQPAFYYPNIGSQMANLNANYGIGGLGAMGAFGNYGMVRRPTLPDQMQAYPALAPPPPPPPPTSTGGKGMRTKPPGVMQPSRPGYGPPTQPGYPPVGTGGKGFQPNPPFQPPPQPTYPNEPDVPDYVKTGGDDVLRPVRPEDGSPSLNPFDPNFSSNYFSPDIDRYNPTVMPAYENPDVTERPLPTPGGENIYTTMPTTPRYDIVEPSVEPQPEVETTAPAYEQDAIDPYMGLDQRNLID